jgi:SAM-dependent methyltransferase
MFQAPSGRVLPLPPAGLRFMGESDDQLIAIGDELAGLLVDFGLTPTSTILDVGCGYGRLALGVLHSIDYRGSYLGFDILPRHIAWCRSAITPAFRRMRFAHLDVRNDRYNARGAIDPTHATFPARSARTDVCALFSVFTHLYRADIERYLAEIRRALRPGGVAVTTWFLFDKARLASATAPGSLYQMVHVLDETTRYAELADPLRAIAYEEGAVREMAQAAGLELLDIERGTWTRDPGRVLQDLVVFRRPASDTSVDADPPAFSLGGRLSMVISAVTARARSLWRAARPRLGRIARRLGVRRTRRG